MLLASIAGCARSQPVIQAGPDPTDAEAAIVSAAIMSARRTAVTDGTVNYSPVEVKSWREMNDRVAPRAGVAP